MCAGIELNFIEKLVIIWRCHEKGIYVPHTKNQAPTMVKA